MSDDPIAGRTREVRLQLPTGTMIERFVLLQDSDSCQSPDDGPQRLEILVEDAGGGAYVILKTDRWACDNVDLAALTAALHTLCQERMP